MVDESGNRPPAEALTSMGASRYRSLLVSLLLCTSLLAGFLLTLSLAVYDSSSTGWGDRESFEVRSTQYQAGIPAWFVCNKVSVTGQVPAALNLPESDKASPGFHVRWLKFAVAFVLALTLALILSLPVFLSVSRIPTRQLIKMSIAIILVVIATDFFGFFVVQDAPSSPPGLWILIGIVLLAIIGSACFFRSYPFAIVIAIFATLAGWWSFRISFALRADLRDIEPPDYEAAFDVIPLAVFIPVLSVVSFAFVFLSRRIFPRRAGN